MPQSRKSQVSLIDTPYYHCVSRCVRRSFLCGMDKYSGQSYDHRRGWVEDRLLFFIYGHKLHKGTLLTQKYLKGDKLSSGELISFNETVKRYRQRLHDISWFMRNLNEYIAREANKEDGCTGRFYSPPSMVLTLWAS
jgi:hypothetical protein